MSFLPSNQAKRVLKSTMKEDIAEAKKRPIKSNKSPNLPLIHLADKDKQLRGNKAPKGRSIYYTLNIRTGKKHYLPVSKDYVRKWTIP